MTALSPQPPAQGTTTVRVQLEKHAAIHGHLEDLQRRIDRLASFESAQHTRDVRRELRRLRAEAKAARRALTRSIPDAAAVRSAWWHGG